MGQYLAIGLPYEILVSPERIYNPTISLQEVREEISRSLLYDMDLFDGDTIENDYVFILKNKPLQQGLIPFLESFYPKIYIHDGQEYPQALETLRSLPFEQWFDFARDKKNDAFQMDQYADPQFIRFQKPFRPVMSLHFQCLLLYHGNGNISTEGIGDFTRFFKYCMHETFTEHPIAKALKVYITG